MQAFPSDKLLQQYAPLIPVTTSPDIVAHQAHDFFRLWDALEKEQGEICNIPFWASVWPGAKSLARYIRNNPSLVAGKTVLDFGCGSGVVSIAASKAGASRVVANDIDPVALFIAERNFIANKVEIIQENRNLLQEKPTTPFKVAFVSDMFYERSSSGALLGLLKELCASSAEVIIADGSRPFTPKEEVELLLQEWIEVDLELEGIASREVHLLRLRTSNDDC